jgi:hypothetical protein
MKETISKKQITLLASITIFESDASLLLLIITV